MIRGHPNRRLLAAAPVVLLLLVVSCASASQSTPADTAGAVTVSGGEGDGLHGTDVSDVIRRPGLRLLDVHGQSFDLRARPADEITVLFFGYTHCPDVCPTTMADLAAARRRLPERLRSRLQVVFVTEDPARDSSTVLAAWLRKFDASFLGVIGGNPRTTAALDALKAPRTERRASATAGHAGVQASAVPIPVVEHSGSVYVFTSRRTVVYTGGTTPGEYAADWRRLASR